MGFYDQQVLPRMIDKACGMASARPLRERVCAGLHGEVIEIGFGSGHNVRFYPQAVAGVTAVEPSDTAWRLAAKRLAEAGVPVQRGALDGQILPYPDGSFDCALTSWTLCTVPDAGAALGELRRVLKPSGTLHFLEHGLAPDERVQRWQHRLDPIERRVFGGCSFVRPIVKTLTEAGFDIAEVDIFYEKGAPKFAGADSLGVAHPA